MRLRKWSDDTYDIVQDGGIIGVISKENEYGMKKHQGLWRRSIRGLPKEWFDSLAAAERSLEDVEWTSTADRD